MSIFSQGARSFLLLALLTAWTLRVPAQEPVTTVADLEWNWFQAHCRGLLTALANQKCPMPLGTTSAVERLLQAPPQDPDRRAIAIQELLDPYCLVVVTINPESRVKAVRGPAPAELKLGRETICLVKVINEAGVTHRLHAGGPQVRDNVHAGAERWLEISARGQPPLRGNLSGQRAQYCLFGLTAREMGKREASLQFDVGQGTQDLGFRAELPILFKVTGDKP